MIVDIFNEIGLLKECCNHMEIPNKIIHGVLKIGKDEHIRLLFNISQRILDNKETIDEKRESAIFNNKEIVEEIFKLENKEYGENFVARFIRGLDFLCNIKIDNIKAYKISDEILKRNDFLGKHLKKKCSILVEYLLKGDEVGGLNNL